MGCEEGSLEERGSQCSQQSGGHAQQGFWEAPHLVGPLAARTSPRNGKAVDAG